ncbi:MAG: ribosome silencing factor [Pseudomonadota bacterium]
MAVTYDGSAKAAHAEAVGPQDQLAIVLESLDGSKAEDVVAIDVTGKTPLADHMVVASGRSHRHVGAVADHLMRDLKTGGVKRVRVEGLNAADWVLIDAGDVIVHVFRPEVRTFYNLEKMWKAEAASHVELVG